MKQIALGVLTYNHPDVVSDILETSKKTYSIFADFGLDIYYLDSSETKETKEIVEREIKNGFTNLYYVNIPSKMSPAKKLQNFLMGKYCNDEYNNYWPIKDRVIFNVKNLMNVYSSALIGQYDLIFLDGYGKNKGIEGETHDYLIFSRLM
ncbi:MAG: hypothetical protein IJR29_05425 [Butyrivibrio sp.]|nr:hypothetical protein [Butyrivibrio sp.]